MSNPSELIGWNDYSYSYGDREIRTINPSIQSGSTVLFESYEDMQLHDKGQYPGVTYGTGGLSTQKNLEEAICKLENGHISRAFPSGINAIICTLMAFTQSGDEVLLTDNVYGPTARSLTIKSYIIKVFFVHMFPNPTTNKTLILFTKLPRPRNYSKSVYYMFYFIHERKLSN